MLKWEYMADHVLRSLNNLHEGGRASVLDQVMTGQLYLQKRWCTSILHYLHSSDKFSHIKKSNFRISNKIWILLIYNLTLHLLSVPMVDLIFSASRSSQHSTYILPTSKHSLKMLLAFVWGNTITLSLESSILKWTFRVLHTNCPSYPTMQHAIRCTFHA